ncbi:hypothetical protein shim_31670 [Shimia sp. SK013]|nr:hypothetical protein shim_31670 [Shimia sp. SK013]
MAVLCAAQPPRHPAPFLAAQLKRNLSITMPTGWPYRFEADVGALLVQQVFNIAEQQREPHIEPHGQTDDFQACSKVSRRRTFWFGSTSRSGPSLQMHEASQFFRQQPFVSGHISHHGVSGPYMTVHYWTTSEMRQSGNSGRELKLAKFYPPNFTSLLSV